jgi:acetyl esterase
MPVDPQIQALLDKGTGVPATHTLTVAEAREQYEARISVMAPPAAVGSVSQRTIHGPGGSMALRIYTPSSPSPYPLLVLSWQRLCPVQPRYA